MAYEIPNFYVGVLPADEDLSAKQFYGAAVVAADATTGTGNGGAAVEIAALASSPMLGVIQNAPQLGEAAQLMVEGITKAKLGGTVAIGDLLKCGTDGKFTVAGTGDYAVAVALESGVNGEIAAILLQRNGQLP